MPTLLNDLRFCIRQLRKAPAFTATAILTLALGIGATTAVFSVIQGALRLHFPNAARLMTVQNVYPTATYDSVSYPDFQEWKRSSKSFSALVAIYPGRKTWKGPNEPVMLNVSAVSDGFLSAFGLEPLIGRTLSGVDERKGAAPVCVLSETFWRQQFDGSASALGKTMVFGSVSYSIVGVVPDMVPSLYREAQAWIPLEANPPYDQHGTNYLSVTGLLKPGISVRQGQSDLALVQSQIDKQFPDNKHGIGLQSLSQTLFGDIRPVMTILLAAVSFILLIACVNLASMMLARATDRSREFLIRTALGASPWRLLRQNLAESTLIAFSGGVLGVAIAFAISKIPVSAWPNFLESPSEVRLDSSVLLFTAALVIVTSFLFGIAPAFQVLRQSSNGQGRGDTRTVSDSKEQRYIRSGLMVTEVAFTSLLVCGALGVAVYFSTLLHTDPGVQSDHVLAMDISLPASHYATDAEQQRFFKLLERKLDGLPGVERVGGVSVAPFSGNSQTSNYSYQGSPPDNPANESFAEMYFVTPGFFKTMGVALQQGRLFKDEDTTETPKVIIINRSFATKLWPNSTPLGKQIKVVDGSTKEIVGVVADVRAAGISQPAGDQIYLSNAQYSSSTMTMVLKTKSDPLDLVQAAKQTVHEMDPGLVVSNLSSVEALKAKSVAGQKTATMLMAALGALALLLSSIGIYGVIAYSVSRRVREFGIRLALGSSRYQIYTLLLKSTGWLVLAGLVIGISLLIPLNGWMRSLIGFKAGLQPLALIGTVLLLGFVATIATIIPSRRAAHTDPMRALRPD